MGAISPHALAALVKHHDEGEMVYVRIKEPSGFRFRRPGLRDAGDA